VPPEILDATLCERFNCLPSQLDNEDGTRLLSIIYAGSIAEAFQRLRQNKQTAEDMEILGPILTEEARRQRT